MPATYGTMNEDTNQNMKSDPEAALTMTSTEDSQEITNGCNPSMSDYLRSAIFNNGGGGGISIVTKTEDGPSSHQQQDSPPGILQNFSMDSQYDEEVTEMSMKLTNTRGKRGSVTATLESVLYDAAAIRQEFKVYHSVLPHPDKLLQEQHSVETLRALLEKHNLTPPRFLLEGSSEFIKPHHALCCLLLHEYNTDLIPERRQSRSSSLYQVLGMQGSCNMYTKFVQALSMGAWYPQLNHPAAFIRDQFYRAAPAMPRDVVKPEVLRTSIRNAGLPIPNYFFDPEEPKQFPPHIALLVILQDGEEESRKLDNACIQIFFSIIAFVALLLRIVLEVIGGAGAIWGGAEVFGLRGQHNAELWRWISVGVGILCLFRFITLNAPQREDEGDILGPAGPWSLRFPTRLRAIVDHPFHYFFRGLPPAAMQMQSLQVSNEQY